MKKMCLYFMCLMMASGVYAKQFSNQLPVVSLQDIKGQMVQEFLVNQDFVIMCKEGSEIPLQFLFNHPIASLQIDPNLKFVAKQTCYFRMHGKRCYLSFDGVNWEKPGRLTNQPPVLQRDAKSTGFVVEIPCDFKAKRQIDVDEN